MGNKLDLYGCCKELQELDGHSVLLGVVRGCVSSALYGPCEWMVQEGRTACQDRGVLLDEWHCVRAFVLLR